MTKINHHLSKIFELYIRVFLLYIFVLYVITFLLRENDRRTMVSLKKIFVMILVFGALLWSVVPWLRSSLPMDTAEAIVWGKYCLWGTTKHPPLSGWLAYGFYHLSGNADKIMYLLSQLCVIIGLWYIYKSARCFLAENKAILAALLQLGIIYYHFSAVEFNVNVLSIALWPLGSYYFWRGYTDNKWKNWLLFGLFAGLNLLNKYIGGVLLLTLALFATADKKAFALLKNIKVWVAGLVCLAVLVPHLQWLYATDFEMLNYMVSRGGKSTIAFPLNHIVYPLKFLAAQLLFAAAMLITFFGFYRHSAKEKRPAVSSATLFIAITAAAPVLIFALIAVISGNSLKSMWGFPCLYMWGTALFYFWPWQPSSAQERKLAYTMAGWSVLFASAYAVQCLLTTSPRFTTDGKAFAAQMEQKWQENLNAPLRYVGGDVWYTSLLNLYASADIKPMVWMSPKNNPWFDADDFAEKGALVIAGSIGEYGGYAQNCATVLSAPQKMTLAFKNYSAKTKYKDVYYGFCLPKEAENGK